MRTDRILAHVAAAVAQAKRLPTLPEAEDRLILDLGFDSLDIAALALELELELGHPVAVNDWIATAAQIGDLSVGSLAAYLEGRYAEESSV